MGSFSALSKGHKKIPLPYPKLDTKEPVTLWLCFSMCDSCTNSNSLRKGSSGTWSPCQNTDCPRETVKLLLTSHLCLTLPSYPQQALLCQLPKLDGSQCMEFYGWPAHNIMGSTGNSWSYTELLAMVCSLLHRALKTLTATKSIPWALKRLM